MQLIQQTALDHKVITPTPVPNQCTSKATFLPFTDAGNDWQGRFLPVVLDDGTWMGVWLEGTNHSDYNTATHTVNITFSDDEGATWTANNFDLDGNAVSGFPLIPPTASTGFIDFNIIKCPNGDLVLLTQNRGSNPGVWNNVNFTWHQYRSTDNGKTWTYDFDWCAAVGFSTAAAKAKIQGNYVNLVIGKDIYIICCEVRTSINDGKMSMYKSTDNCATWSFLSDVIAFDETAFSPTEPSLIHLGGGRFFVVNRTEAASSIIYKQSNDYGLTWSTATNFSPLVGYIRVHQPYLTRFANFTMLSGRDYKTIPSGSNRHSRNVYFTTTDFFASNITKRYLDPYYAGNGITDAVDSGDSGYAKCIQKRDGSFIFFGYFGTGGASRIYKYDVSHTNSPSAEQYANFAFLPTTLSTNGIRLQLNRDNIYETGASPVLGGLAVFERAHNMLLTGSTYFLAAGTAKPEFIVANDKGWAVFNGTSRFLSVSSIGNTLHRSSFSIGMWIWPDDGQPAATQILYRDSSNIDTTITHIVQIFLSTAGKISVRYAIGGTVVIGETASAVFTDGAQSSPKHLAVTFTSGGLIRIYMDGVLQTLDAVNSGNMAALTMSSYTTSNQTHIGMRQTGAITFDLGYIGKMREVMCQPVVWSAGDIANIMLN